jgi:3'-phosphoadenosine 5'-phosphosulfate sulfotransferase (PAPS reductase)/FAD synthetase
MTDTTPEGFGPQRGAQGQQSAHVVMYSTGIGSWATAKRVIDTHGPENVTLLFCDVKGDNDDQHLGEHPDNYRFLEESAEKFGAKLVWLKSSESIWDVYKRVRFLGNSRIAPCSHELKQKPARAWIDANCDPETTTLYVGIDWMEAHRMPAVERNYLPYIVKAPMIEPPYIDKADMLQACRDWGVEPPSMYQQAWPHANCQAFCVRAGQAQFRQLLRLNRDGYLFHEDKEQELRELLGKDVSVLRDRTNGTSVPLTLRAFRERIDAQPTLFDETDWGGCGCFVDAEETA